MSRPTPEPFSDVASVLDWLATFTDFEQKQAHLLGRRSLDLARARRYCRLLGHPERGGYAVAHVAGSKGKGSTCAFLERLAIDGGHDTALFLSPHLIDVRERIRVQGESIRPEAFVAHAETLRRAVETVVATDPLEAPSFFESMVLMAFLEFRRHDLAIVEVGLGGRLDATNVVPKDVTVITTLDLEHTRVLGPDLASIGREKAGILTPGVPLVTALHPAEEGGHAVHRRARDLGVDVFLEGRDYEIRIHPDDAGAPCPRFDYRGLDHHWEGLRLGTPGRHQVQNAGLALTATILLAQGAGRTLDPEGTRRSLAATRVPARQELFPAEATPALAEAGDLLLDAAHTPRSMAALAEVIPLLVPDRPRALILGMLRDKDLDACLAPLAGLFDLAVAAPPASPRALDASTLAASLRRLPGLSADEVLAAEDPASGFEAARAAGARSYVATGSVYLAGALRALLSDRQPD